MKRTVFTCFIFFVILCLCSCASGQELPELEASADSPTPIAETSPATVPTEDVTEATACTEIEMEAEAVSEPEPEAELISEGVTVHIGNFDRTDILDDGNVYTRHDVDYRGGLTVESEQLFSAVYVEWWKIPLAYEIVWDGGRLSCGENDFAHDYIRLPEPVNRIEFVFADDELCSLSNLSVFTDGTAPTGVQDWLPPCEEADILVFPTHSDDDVLFFGPVIAYYAIEAELTVQTAFMVDHVSTPVRIHERLNGLWELGVRHYPILGSAPDTPTHSMYEAMNWYANSDVMGWQIEQIRRFKPLVVLGHDLNGEYGNGGHKVNAHYLVQAVDAANDPEQYPDSAEQYGVWNVPKFYLHLYEENEWYFDVLTPLEKDPEGRSPFEIATVALRNHQSQMQYDTRMQYAELRSMDCRPFGLYRTLVGYDTVADVMENIVPEDWRH